MSDRYRRRRLASFAMPVLMAAAGLWALLQLPAGARVPIHFDATGQVNGWADADWGLFVLPAMAAVTLGVLLWMPRVGPRAERPRESPGPRLNIALAVQLLFAFSQAAIVGQALGHPVDLARWMLSLMGLLFAVVGNMAPKLRWNRTVGIRTPWTLADERVWDRTHRFGGRLFFVAGALMMIAGLSPAAAVEGARLIPAIAIGVAGVCVGQSWLVWREVTRTP